MSDITVVVGGQFGSEAKGHVTDQVIRTMINDDTSVLNIRVAGPNAGHTVLTAQGQAIALRQIPVGAVSGMGERGLDVHIAAGSEVEIPVLLGEVAQLRALGIYTGVTVSPEATVLEEYHKLREAERGLTVDSGRSTGKGIGAARADRLMRGALRMCDLSDTQSGMLWNAGIQVTEPDWTNYRNVVIEGTQGYGLGLHGGEYPYVTSSDCRAIDFLAMAGISPWDAAIENLKVLVVARVFPIRIAGNSGPLYAETTWEALGLPEERTTVTNRVRRVGGWDWNLISRAVKANGGAGRCDIVLTMVDERWPLLRDVHGHGWGTADGQSKFELAAFISDIEQTLGVNVTAITNGPRTMARKHALYGWGHLLGSVNQGAQA